jgi:hypothetical protein
VLEINNLFKDEDFNSKIFKNNKGLEFIILGKNKEKICRTFSYKIKFIKTGLIRDVLKTCIVKGNIKDYKNPSIYGVGYADIKYGFIKNNLREYNCWKGIMRRCYSKKFQISSPTYIGCTADVKWHSFKNFCNDIPYIENYKLWKENFNFQLDKDVKIKGNKIYSKDTCMFITSYENSLESANRNVKKRLTGKIYLAKRISDGYEEMFTNQAEFARKYKTYQQNIRKVLKKERNSCGGWTFQEVLS